MYHLKIGDKDLKIKFGYEATIRSKILKGLAEIESQKNENDFDKMQYLMEFMPEFVLVGLQTFYREEYGYNYDTLEGKEEQISKVYGLLEEYFDSEDSDFMELFENLQTELTDNGFLASLFRKEKAKAEQKVKRFSKKEEN